MYKIDYTVTIEFQTIKEVEKWLSKKGLKPVLGKSGHTLAQLVRAGVVERYIKTSRESAAVYREAA